MGNSNTTTTTPTLPSLPTLPSFPSPPAPMDNAHLSYQPADNTMQQQHNDSNDAVRDLDELTARFEALKRRNFQQ